MIDLIKRTLQKIFKTSFAKSVALLMTGTAISQLISVLFYPIITRVFLPEDFGIYVLFNSILGIVTVVGALRYEFSIPIVANKFKALNALFMSLIILVIICILLSIVIFFFGDTLLNTAGAEKLAPFKYFIIMGVLFSGLYSILNQWTLRVKAFKKLSITRVSRGLSLNVSQTILGIFKAGGIGLITGKVIGEFSGNIVLIRQILKSEKKPFSKFNIEEIKYLLVRYKKFPLFTAPSQLFNKAGLELPVFFITSIFGSSVIGLYGLAHLIVSLPMNLIGSAVGDVFYSEAATSGRLHPESLLKRSNNLLKKLTLMGSLPLVILLLFGPFLFGFIFGEEWTESGNYARIISILVFFRFIFTPISRVFEVFERQIQAFVIDVVRLVLVFTIFTIVEFYNLTSFQAVGLYSALMALLYLITYILARRILIYEIRKKKSLDQQ